MRASDLVPFPRFACQVSQSASDLSARPTSIRLRSRTALAAHVPSAACRGASVVPRLQRQLRSRCPTLSVSWQDSPGGFARPRGSVFHSTAAVLVEFGLTSQSRGTYIVRCTMHVPLSPALGAIILPSFQRCIYRNLHLHRQLPTSSAAVAALMGNGLRPLPTN